MNNKRQHGVALIVVLLVVAMVTIVATEMTTRLQLNIGKVSAIKDNNQAYWYSMGAEQLAIRVLTQQIALDNDVFHLQQPWAQKEFNYPIPNGTISGQLSDMRTCYNLNALANKPEAGQPFQQREVFETLLEEIEWEVSSLDRDTLLGNLIDWLDSDQQLTDFGAEDSDYEALQFPYLPANDLMVNTSELRLLNVMSRPLMEQLLPHVCTIPDETAMVINVNTIEAEQASLLSAMLGSNVSKSQAQSIISNRPPEGYSDINQFLGIKEVAAAKLSSDEQVQYAVTSRYFSLRTTTRYNNTRLLMTSLLKIEKDKPISVIRREFGGIR